MRSSLRLFEQRVFEYVELAEEKLIGLTACEDKVVSISTSLFLWLLWR
jgi:hypothetical protein